MLLPPVTSALARLLLMVGYLLFFIHSGGFGGANFLIAIEVYFVGFIVKPTFCLLALTTTPQMFHQIICW